MRFLSRVNLLVDKFCFFWDYLIILEWLWPYRPLFQSTKRKEERSLPLKALQQHQKRSPGNINE
ncbi:MAG: hypothetical protein F6K31_13730 [Symploca sp. SIO2G7]|nr:hypothetical protein [Symploca sp. SIO2G7]